MPDSLMGHNQPPLEERLPLEYSVEMKRSEELLEAFERMPEKVDSEDMASKATDFVKQLKAYSSDVEDKRVAEKKPYNDANTAIQAFFKPLKDPIDAKVKVVEKRLGFFTRAKAEEEQKRRRAEAKALEEKAKASTAYEAEAEGAKQKAAEPVAQMAKTKGNMDSQTITREVLGFQRIDQLNAGAFIKLAPFFKPEEIDKAIRAFMKEAPALCKEAANGGTQPIPGVTFEKQYSTHVR